MKYVPNYKTKYNEEIGAQDYLEVTIERHYTDIKELMTSYQKLILENQIVLEELAFSSIGGVLFLR